MANKRREFNAATDCGAKTTSRDGRCKNRKGMRTDHPDVGRCWKHGGATPVKHGLYSDVDRPRIRELMKRIEAEVEDIEDLRPELILLKALVADYLGACRQ